MCASYCSRFKHKQDVCLGAHVREHCDDYVVFKCGFCMFLSRLHLLWGADFDTILGVCGIQFQGLLTLKRNLERHGKAWKGITWHMTSLSNTRNSEMRKAAEPASQI